MPVWFDQLLNIQELQGMPVELGSGLLTADTSESPRLNHASGSAMVCSLTEPVNLLVF